MPMNAYPDRVNLLLIGVTSAEEIREGDNDKCESIQQVYRYSSTPIGGPMRVIIGLNKNGNRVDIISTVVLDLGEQ